MSWIKYLQDRAVEPWAPQGSAPIDWLTEGECARVNEYVLRFKPTQNGSRHDMMVAAVAGIARLGARGHGGTILAMEYIRHLFLESVADESRRDAEAEIRRAIEPLASKLAGSVPEVCKGPLCGQIEELESEVLEDQDYRRERMIEQEVQRMEIQVEAKRRFKERNLKGEDAAVALDAKNLLLREDKESNDLIEGLIPENGVVLLTAERKSGKTTLLLNVAQSLVDGIPFLGRKVRKLEGKVLLMDLEMSETMLKSWIRRMEFQNLEQFLIMQTRGHVTATFAPLLSDYSEFAKQIKDQNVEVLIIDPLAPLFAMLGWSENDNSDVRRALGVLSDFANIAGVKELLLAHHTGWLKSGDRVKARGASSFEDVPDNLWRLQRNENNERMFSTMGRMADLDEHLLNFDQIYGRLSLGGTAKGIQRESAMLKMDTLISEFLSEYSENDGWVSKTIIRKAIGRSPSKYTQSVDDSLGLLILTEKIEERSTGKGFKEYRWIRL